MQALPQATYTAPEAGKLLGLSEKQIYKVIRRGDIEAEYDAQGRMRVHPHELYRYMRSKN